MNALAQLVREEARIEALDPSIRRALSVFPPAIERQAEITAKEILESRIRSAHSNPWIGSRLTGDGFPFELAFSTVDDRLRFTVEPGRPNLAPQERLLVACELIERLDARRLPSEVVRTFRALQRGVPLKYGAWIGCRVAPQGSTLKLYVEVSDEAEKSSLGRTPFRLPDRAVSRRMLAYSPTLETFESYFRVDSLEPRHLPAVLAPAGLENRTAELVQFIADAYGYSVRGRLPGPSVGISYGARPLDTPRITLYFYARAIWGSDARIRRGFSRMANAYDWSPDSYLEVSAPLSERESWKTFHGLLGVSVEPSGFSLAIGMRPVTYD